ncbi:MAG: cyclic nucleotide-binding domain-containing protein [Melioribacteraceae bacterium]|nr:cyclic nucleotide-binding domain-containing protein [Melioribacteraceae bacterium]MDD3557131.1 cyclic nucleotide-binding domain-containing protein [Melioribacteraceae bacterium]
MNQVTLNLPRVKIDVAETEEQKEKIYRARFKIEAKEIKNTISVSTDKNEYIKYDYEDNAIIIYAESDDEIIAALSVNFIPTQVNDFFAKNFMTDKFLYYGEGLSYSSNLIVDPKWKGTAILGKLLNAFYHILRRKNIKFDFTDCTPSLVQFYEHLGYRRYKENFFDNQKGFRIPLVLLVEDFIYLEKLRSPFTKIASVSPKDENIDEWFNKNFPAYIGVMSERMMPMKDFWSFLANRIGDDSVPLLKDLTDEEVKKFLMSGIVLKSKKGDRIVRKGDIGNELFVILKGAVEVIGSKDGKEFPIALLGKGEIFGEMGFLSQTERSADVVAISDLEVLVVNQSFLRKAMNSMPTTANKILFNLSIILCERLRSKTRSREDEFTSKTIDGE